MIERFAPRPFSRLTKAFALGLTLLLSACAEDDPLQYVKDGKALLDKGDADGARVQFKNALQANPKLTEAYYQLALLDTKSRDFLSAMRNLKEVVALDPKHVDGQAKLGFLVASDPETAKAQLAIAKALDPENSNVILLGAMLQLRDGNRADALRQVEQVLAKDANNIEAMRLQSGILASDNRYEEALAAANRAIAVYPDESVLDLLKIRIHLEQKKFDEVVRDFDELVAKHPTDKKLRNDQIVTLTKIGKFDEAEQALRDAIAKDPADVETKLTLVNFIESRDPARTQTTLQELIKASPGEVKLKSRLAGYYLGQRHIEDAEALFNEIVAADPTGKEGLQAKVKQAELAWAKGDQASAERLADEVIQVDGGNSQALLFRANMRMAKRDADGAIADLRTVLRDQPNSDQTMALMAQAYAAKGELEVAESHWRKAIEVNPSNLGAIAPLFSTLLKRGDTVRAEELLTKSLSANPNNPSVLVLLVTLRSEQKNWAGAEAALNELKNIPRAALAAQMLNGQLAAARGRQPEAIQSFKAVLAQKPDHDEALLALVNAHEASGKRAELIGYMKTFIQQNPNNIGAYNTLGVAYKADKKLAEAAAILREAIKRNPKAVTTYKLLAGVLAQQGKLAEVPELLKQGLEATGHQPELMLELAEYYNGVNERGAAIEIYTELLEKYPGIDDAANNLAYLLIEFDQSPGHIERAVKLTERFKASKNPAYLDTYGWVLFKSGKPEAAVEVLKQATQMLPENAEFYFHLGEAYYGAGDDNAAKTALQQSLALGQKFGGFPETVRAKELLKLAGG